jgi:hypothetical protein
MYEEFPQIELKLVFGDIPPLFISIFYVFFILLITLLIYMCILIFDITLEIYNKKNYSRNINQNNN